MPFNIREAMKSNFIISLLKIAVIFWMCIFFKYVLKKYNFHNDYMKTYICCLYVFIPKCHVNAVHRKICSNLVASPCANWELYHLYIK